jgi:hypothetical protein
LNGVKKLPVPAGLALLFAAVAIGTALVISARSLDESRAVSPADLPQVILFMIGTLILWYSSHPLAHYISAKALGVKTLYFYVGRSELRKSGIGVVKSLAGHLVTIGTKLDAKMLPRLTMIQRAFIYGSGAIISACVSALIFLYSVSEGYNPLTVAIALIFFLFSVTNELVLSTKSGDIAKMRKALGR